MVVNDGTAPPDDGQDNQPDSGRPESDIDPEQYFLLHDAAENDSPETVTGLAHNIADVDFIDDDDEEYPGRTALWTAVFANRPDNARALVAAGADPLRPMMNGWSPGRLSLAGPTPALFSISPGPRPVATRDRRRHGSQPPDSRAGRSPLFRTRHGLRGRHDRR